MKKTIILLACAFLVCLNTFAYDVDVIITKSREQIQCMIISQNGDTITYKSTYQDDQQIYKIAKSDVEKVFIHDKEPAKSTTTNTKPAPQKVVNDGQEVKKAVSQTAPAAQSKVKSDLIITKDAKKIDAKIIEVSKNEIKYKELDNLEGPTLVLETKEISSIIYVNGKVVLYNDEAKSEKDNLEKAQSSSSTDENSIEILLLSGEKITAHAKELTDDILYFTVDGEHRTMAASRVEKVTYLQSGQVKQYHSKTIPAESVSESNKKELNLARANNYSGVYVFTDCTPVAEYEVLGEVYFDKEGAKHVSVLPTYGVSPNGHLQVTGSQVLSYSETPQYNDIRNGLVTQSVMANRQVEGILVTIPKEGEGRATIIKFKDGATNKDLARVNSHLGVFVFTDCMPVNTYTFVGKIEGAGGVNSDYNILRDRLIKKAQKKYSEVQGIITRLVSGNKDTAEAIKF